MIIDRGTLWALPGWISTLFREYEEGNAVDDIPELRGEEEDLEETIEVAGASLVLEPHWGASHSLLIGDIKVVGTGSRATLVLVIGCGWRVILLRIPEQIVKH